MEKSNYINGYSKLTNEAKVDSMAHFLGKTVDDFSILNHFKLPDSNLQARLEEISENVLSNYMLPYSIAPNFLVNGKHYLVPMVIEESSVVAAASAAAKFWFSRGGFTSKVVGTTKVGQVHFKWLGNGSVLNQHFPKIKDILINDSEYLLANMKKRNGGITGIELLDFTHQLPNYYQIRVSFETADAMGANIINSVLEEMAQSLKQYFADNFEGAEADCEIVMAILSNHTPESLVECYVECDIEGLAEVSGSLLPADYALKFKTAVDIANIDIYRATTHNKGIYNGIDAVALATGNDFRAVEACGHSYASRDGHYKSLTTVDIDNGKFRYTLRIPMALGTVGGLTTMHPLAKLSLEILGNPSARELMEITAAAGLANTFSAVRALTTSGIQKGHMRFHLNNSLNTLGATEQQKLQATKFFKDKKVSHKAVQDFLGK
ncbi:hydroxymethylglutaryl-CoA reductase, degradative [Perlabentimonas gracilis]|uniref:hydroxymethylglutaryl-CoA reductase, degradative n=1 Tax=Perlabentimonas gracilis TaxID=2715279 RepID=UPI001408CFF9|nr:hydroxymethylglutaryl-CoA reductase, degradative [Perlabentimonas gracilis]NHB67414.1 hydroxymethylglutaryl-CoA reductase, degradative [Perlabentimonas gracilis]